MWLLLSDIQHMENLHKLVQSEIENSLNEARGCQCSWTSRLKKMLMFWAHRFYEQDSKPGKNAG